MNTFDLLVGVFIGVLTTTFIDIYYDKEDIDEIPIVYGVLVDTDN